MKGNGGVHRLGGLAFLPLLFLMIVMAGCTAGSSATNSAAESNPPPHAGTEHGVVKNHAGAGQGPMTADPGSKPGDGAENKAAEEAVAVVGGKTITRAELTDHLMTGYGAEVLRELMLREAVAREAASLGVAVTDEELNRELHIMSEGYGSDEAFYASMLRQLGMDRTAVREDALYHLLLEKLVTWDVRIAETEIRQYYDDHPQEFGPRVQYKLSWILTSTNKDAARVLEELENGADFGDLAVKYSLDGATADQGGELGWVDAQDPLQSAKLLNAADQLQVGEAAGPLQVDQGYAVLQLNGKKTLQGKPYADVREEIRRQLAMEQAKSMQDLQQALLIKYGAKVLDPRLVVPDAE